jgi:hypothetical protein
MEARVDENAHDSLAALRGVQEGDRVPCRGGDGREHEQNGRSKADWDDKGQSHAYKSNTNVDTHTTHPGEQHQQPLLLICETKEEKGRKVVKHWPGRLALS